MNKDDLNTIKARAEKATPGPWDIGHEAPPLYASNQSIVAQGKIIFSGNTNFDLFRDAEFIAHARQDIPALVAEVERLQRLVAIARLHFVGPDKVDGMDGIDYADKFGLYQEYLEGIPWKDRFLDEYKPTN